ncbi:MAG TPA: PEGA domain-containing protein [Kofleriaceae bacterium]|jgi:hypothetical protein
MRNRVALGLVLAFASRAVAQPAPGGDIEMDPDDSTKKPDEPAPDPNAPVQKDPKVAKRWLGAAQQLVQKGNYFASHGKPDDAKAQYENAMTAYEKAIETGDDPNVYFDAAAIEEKLGKLDAAVHYLKMVQAAQKGVRADIAKKTATKLDDLTAKVAMLTLTVKPEGAAIALAGAELGKAPLGAPLVLMPGTYTFTVTADGFQPKDVEVKVDAGSEAEKAIDLDPVPVIVESPRNATADLVEPPPKPPTKSMLPTYIGGAATIVGIGGTAAFGLLAVHQHTIFVRKTTAPLDREDAQTNGKNLALASDISLGVAVAGAAFTAYWLFFHHPHAHRAATDSDTRHPPPVDESAKLDVVPWVQASGGGFSVAGAF